MKKLFVVITTLFLTFNLFAQPERMPFGEGSNNTIKPGPKAAKPVQNSKNFLFFESFDSYHEVLGAGWIVSRTDNLQGNNPAFAATPKWFLCTPNSFSGNGATYIRSLNRSVAISYTAKDFTWLAMKDPVTLPNESGYTLEFFLWYYNIPDLNLFTQFHVLIYDVGLQTWNNLASWNQDSLSNRFQRKIYLSLDSYAGKAIKVAFVYENRGNLNTGNQLSIDDISITNRTSPVFEMVPLRPAYSSYPKFLIDTLVYSPSAIITNYGKPFNDTLRLKVSAYGFLNNPNYKSTGMITDTVGSGEIRFMQTSPKLKLSDCATVGLVYELYGDDSFNAFDWDSLSVRVSQDTFSTNYGMWGGISVGKDKEFGTVYRFNKNAFINSVNIGWGWDYSGGVFTPFNFEIKIYELEPNGSTIAKLLYSKVFSKQERYSDSYVNYPIKPILCLQGTQYLVAVKQLGLEPLNVGYDAVPFGKFWSVSTQNPLSVTSLSSSTWGNVAVQVIVAPAVDTPKLNFVVTDEKGPISGLAISFSKFDPAAKTGLQTESGSIAKASIIESVITDVNGFASATLPNGLYFYHVNHAGFAPVRDTLRVNYQNLNLNIVLQKPSKVKFVVKSGGTPVAGAEISVSDSLAITNPLGVDSLMLTPGNYAYTIVASGFKPFTGTFEIVGKDTILDIALTAAQTYAVKLTVKDDSNKLVNLAKIDLMGYGQKLTADNGTLIFGGVEPANSIPYTVYKYGYSPSSGTITVTDQNLTDTISVELIRYKTTFYISNGKVGLSNASVKVGELSAVATSSMGYAVVNGVAPGASIPYTISLNGFHLYAGSYAIFDSDVRENVILTPVTTPYSIPGEFSVFPNPSRGVFRVKGEGIFAISVFDLTGRLIVQHVAVEGEKEVIIAASPAGIYLMRIQSAAGSATRRIIKY